MYIQSGIFPFQTYSWDRPHLCTKSGVVNDTTACWIICFILKCRTIWTGKVAGCKAAEFKLPRSSKECEKVIRDLHWLMQFDSDGRYIDVPLSYAGIDADLCTKRSAKVVLNVLHNCLSLKFRIVNYGVQIFSLVLKIWFCFFSVERKRNPN